MGTNIELGVPRQHPRVRDKQEESQKRSPRSCWRQYKSQARGSVLPNISFEFQVLKIPEITVILGGLDHWIQTRSKGRKNNWSDK